MRRHLIWLILVLILGVAAPSASVAECQNMASSELRDNQFYVRGPDPKDPTKRILIGFATLIQSRGLLITARHVVGTMNDANAADWALIPVTKCDAVPIPFHIVLSGVERNDSFHGSDWAVLFSSQVGEMNLNARVRFKALDEGMMSLSRVVGHVLDNSGGSEPGPFRGVNPPNVLESDTLQEVGECTPEDLYVASFDRFKKGDSGAPVIDTGGAIIGIATEFSYTLPEALAAQVPGGESIVSWLSATDLPRAAGADVILDLDALDHSLSTDDSVHNFKELLDRMGLVLVTPISCVVEAVFAKGPMDPSNRPFDISRDALARRLADGDATPAVNDEIRKLTAPEWLQYVDLVDGYQRWFDTTERAAGSRIELVEQALRDLGSLDSNDYRLRLWPGVVETVSRKTANDNLVVQIAARAHQIVSDFVERVNAGPIDASTFMAYSLDGELGSPGRDAISAAAKLLAGEYGGKRVNPGVVDTGIALILWGLSTSPPEMDKNGKYFGTNVTEISKALRRKARTSEGAVGSDFQAAWKVASFGVTFPNSPATAWDVLSETSVRLGNYSAAWYFASRAAFQRCAADEACSISPIPSKPSRSSDNDDFDQKKCGAYLRQALLANVTASDIVSFIGITDVAPDIELQKTVAGPGPGGKLRVSASDARDAATQIAEFLSGWARMRSHQASQSHSACAPIFPTQQVTVSRTPTADALVVAAMVDVAMPRARPGV